MTISIIQKNWLYLFFGFFTFYILLNSDYFPFLGFGIFGIILSIIFLVFKKLKTFESYFWFTVSSVFCLFLAIYSSPLLTFFNLLIIIYALSGQISSGQKLTLWQFLIWPIHNLIYIIFTSKDSNFRLFPKTEKKLPKQEEKPKEYLKKFLSISFTLIIVIIFAAILSTANPYFSSLIANVFNFFNFLEILKFIKLEYLFDGRTYLAIGLAVVIKKSISFLQDNELQKSINSKNWLGYEKSLESFNQKVDILWPKSGGGLVIFVFLLTQIQLYLASSGELDRFGFRDRAHEVFFQLLIVSLIVLALIFIDISKKRLYKTTSYILLFEAFLLTLGALKSDLEYVIGYGLGPQRLYGFAVIIFTLIALVLTFIVSQNRQDSIYLKRVLASIVLIFGLINLINFDKTIVDYNNFAGKETQVENLSADSQSYRQAYFKNLKSDLKKDTNGPPFTSGISESEMRELGRQHTQQNILRSKIQYLKDKYRNPNWNSFNLLEWQQYQQIKDLETEN